MSATTNYFHGNPGGYSGYNDQDNYKKGRFVGEIAGAVLLVGIAVTILSLYVWCCTGCITRRRFRTRKRNSQDLEAASDSNSGSEEEEPTLSVVPLPPPAAQMAEKLGRAQSTWKGAGLPSPPAYELSFGSVAHAGAMQSNFETNETPHIKELETCHAY